MLLLLAIVALVFQLIPSLWAGLVSIANVRNWSRGTWMLVNVAIVLILLGIRFGPELYTDWIRYRRRHASTIGGSNERRLSANEERALYQRMHEARKRQVV